MTRAVLLFDLDGLLIDSEPKWTDVEASFYLQAGLTFDTSVKKRLIGRTVEGVVETIAHDIGAMDVASLQREFETRLSNALRDVTVLPGVIETLEWALKNHDCAVVTNSPGRIANSSFAVLQRFRVLPDVRVTVDDVQRGKPAPDSYLLASAKLGNARKPIAIEDSRTGIAAARAAEALVIGVSDDATVHAESDVSDRVLSVHLLEAAIKLVLV